MRSLITGAAGFVGRHLIEELLAAGHTVTAGTLEAGVPAQVAPAAGEALSWVELDVTERVSLRRAVEQARPERVFHLAGQSSSAASFQDPLGTWEVNATGTLRLLQVLQESCPAGTRVLVVSSAEAYGVVPVGEQPIAEDRPLRPVSPYGSSKAAAEMAARQANSAAHLEVVIARSFNHVGPGQDRRFAVSSWAHQLAAIRAGQAEPELRVGNLDVRRDLLDVRDVARAYRVLLERGEPGEPYNVCRGTACRMQDVAEQMIELSQTGARLEVDPALFRPVDLPVLIGDASRLRALGWTPRLEVRQTLADVLSAAAAELATP